MSKAHQYRVTLEHLSDDHGNDLDPPPLLQFTASHHDDLFEVLERIERDRRFSVEEAYAFGTGLKLFSEVMLRHRNDPLFAELLPHFGAFMRGLKTRNGRA